MARRKAIVFFYISVSLTLMLSLGVVFMKSPQVAYALGTTYYINNQVGSGCNNAGAGTSTAAPWCDFTNVNSRTFVAGDQILLAKGSTWNSSGNPNNELNLQGSGTSWTNPITVNAYGTGAKPIIRGSGTSYADKTMSLTNGSYWQISNLELAFAGDGFEIRYSATGNAGLRINNLYIHDLSGYWQGVPAGGPWNSTAIAISTTVTNTAISAVLSDVQITNTEIGSTTAGIMFYAPDASNYHTYQNLTVKNNYIHNLPGGAFDFRGTENSIVMDNRLDTLATNYTPSGTTGTFLWRDSSDTFVNNLYNNVPNTNSNDQSAIDAEAYINNVFFRDNYISNTAGSAIEFLQLSPPSGPVRGTDDYMTNNTVSGNTFVNNGGSNGAAPSAIYTLTYDAANHPITGSIINSLYTPSNLTAGDTNQFTSTNNINLAAANIYNGASNFSSVQGTSNWTNQYYNGSSWSNITPYDSTNNQWGSNEYVSRFDLLPNSCSACWIARTWTAPNAGTISIRGRVLKNDNTGGDGVLARITKNSAQIWPTSGGAQSVAYNDQSGYNTDLDSISVSANDVIRFEINNGGSGNASNDTTSWAPTVAYTTTQGTQGNLARGATVSATSSIEGFGWGRTFANDGQRDSVSGALGWTSNGSATNHTESITFDMGSSQSIGQVGLYPRNDLGEVGQGFPINFTIQTSTDGITFNTVVTQTGYAQPGNTVQSFTFTPTTARYVRVQGTNLRPNPLEGNTYYMQLAEVEIYGVPASQGNLALSAVASASDTDTANGYAASKINDGFATTDFSGWANTGTTPSWVQLDFGANTTFNHVELYTTTGYEIRDYQIQYWNGSSWVNCITPVTGNTNNHNTYTFPAVTGSKIRVLGNSGPTIQAGFVRVNELQVYNDSSSSNLAIGAATSASSTDYAGGYSETRINDGNTADFSGWANASATALPQWVQLDFGTNKTLGRVDLYTTTGYALKDYQIQYWNGSSWVTAQTVTGNTLKHVTSTFTAVTGSKLRIYATAGDMYNIARVDELQVYSN